MARPAGTPTPMPIPTATWLLLGRALEEGVVTVAADEGESSDGVDDVDNGNVEAGSADELVGREALVVGVVLVRGCSMVVCIVTGPRPKENKGRDGVEQHPEPSKP